VTDLLEYGSGKGLIMMSGKEDPQKRIDDLIKYGKALLPYQNNDDCLARKQRWDAQCQDTLQRLFGNDNIILKSFRDTLSMATKTLRSRVEYLFWKEPRSSLKC
jgi:hypothetical protein